MTTDDDDDDDDDRLQFNSDRVTIMLNDRLRISQKTFPRKHVKRTLKDPK